jgi:hypothetical protein
MIERRLKAILAALLIGLAPAWADAGDPLRFVGSTSVTLEAPAGESAPKSVEIPVLLAPPAEPVVHVEIVRAKRDQQPVDLDGYTACLAPPRDGRSLWTLRVGSTDDALPTGKHELAVMVWTDADSPSATAACTKENIPANPPPGPGANCAEADCKIHDLTLDVDSPPVRDGELVRLLDTSGRMLNFAADGAPRPVSFAFAPGNGVDPAKLWLFPVATTSTRGNEDGSFRACVRVGTGAAGQSLSEIVLQPLKTDYRLGTYQVALHAVLGENPGLDCDNSGKAPPRPDPKDCKSVAAAGKTLSCQILTLDVERKAAKLGVPAEITVNIERFPLVELAGYLGAERDDGRGFADIWWHYSPIRILETGHDGAADLADTGHKVLLTDSSDSTRTGTLKFGMVVDPNGNLTRIGRIGPGGAIDLAPEVFNLPTGYGTYAGKLKIAAKMATADAREVPVKVNIRMSFIGLALAIVLGIVVGYRYRRRFEFGLPRDRALIGARRVLDKLMRHRDAARDRDLVAALEAALDDLRLAIFGVEASADSVNEAQGAAESALEKALGALSTASGTATTVLYPWIGALTATKPEPAEITAAFLEIRQHIDLLRALLDEGNVARVNDDDGLKRLPLLAEKALTEARAWLAMHKESLQRTALQWSEMRQELRQMDADLQSAETALAKAIDGQTTPGETGKARAALGRIIETYAVLLRHNLANDLGAFVVALGAFADAEGIDTVALRTNGQALARVAASANPAWPVDAFASHAQAVHRAAAKVANALIQKGELGDDTDEIDDSAAVARAYAAWKSDVFGGDAAAQGEVADDEVWTPVEPLYRIVPPPVVYKGERQLWRIEASGSAAALPETVTWTMAGQPQGFGHRPYLKISQDGDLTATLELASGPVDLHESVTLVMTDSQTSIAYLQDRIKSAIFRRTIWNGVLITIFGVAILRTFETGYPGLIAALVWGLAADISADRLSTVMARAPKP